MCRLPKTGQRYRPERYATEPSPPEQLHIVPAVACLNRARPGTAGQQVTPGTHGATPGTLAEEWTDLLHIVPF